MRTAPAPYVVPPMARRTLGSLLGVCVLLGAANAVAAAGPAATVILHHPHPDDADPFGFPFGGADSFTARHGHLEADTGRFDYPYFVADGVLPIAGLPDSSEPYVSTLEAYGLAVAERAAEEAPVALRLSSEIRDGTLALSLRIEPGTALPGEHLHAWGAVLEDPVRYRAPAGLTNGVTDHRFTLRALADLGPLDLSNGTAADVSWLAALGEWSLDRLVVAAWVEQSAPSPRFDAHEVVQATHAPAGASVHQDSKGVLVEVLSATWCEPCLYGDLAAEDLAVSLGSAEPLREPRTRYLEGPARPWLTIPLSLAAGVAVAAWARRSAP